jgi:DNA repair exonuclease SbcCD ATPase subunit
MNNSVRIKKISISRLGPVDEFIMEPGDLNLIYGKNETGKTYIVEFIINSLLGSEKRWNLRDIGSVGKITVSGLHEKAKEFSPAAKEKLKTYMEKTGTGLPPGLEKLLVIKGADSAISDGPGGVNPGAVKRLLSEREILDKIEGKIPATFTEAQVKEGIINISRKSNDARDMYAAREELEKTEKLLNDINRNYTLGPVVSLNREMELADEKIKEQNRARRHRGYILFRRAEELKSLRGELNPDEAEMLRNKIVEYKTTKENIVRDEARLKEAKSLSGNYVWLAEAADIYDGILKGGKISSFRQNILIITALALTAFVPLLGISKMLSPVIAAIFAVLFLIFKKRGVFINKNASEEVKAIREKYNRLFRRELTGFSDLKEKLKEEERYRDRASDIKENIKEPRRKLQGLTNEINQIFLKIPSNVPEPAKAPETVKWEEAADDFKNKIRENEKNISDTEKKLAKLNLGQEEYLKERAGEEYDEKKLRELEEERKKTEEKRQGYLDSLGEIKNRLVQETSADINESFNRLIDKLRKKRENILSRLKQLRAKIIGLNSVYKVIEELKLKEDKKIKESLSSDIVQSPVKEITQRYNRVKLDGKKVIVSDKYRDYNVADISTGALEQILIALRMGITRKVMGDRKMFFIFDDAFQHTDWKRREYLTESLVSAAAAGWQIFYFTMDDHIRDLFKKKGKKLKDGFRYRQI